MEGKNVMRKISKTISADIKSFSAECVCAKNLKAHLATILCQPLDVEVASSQIRAVFEVKAVPARREDKLLYQWYFNENPIDPINRSYRPGSIITPRLTVLNLSIKEAGFYHCEIDSVNAYDAASRRLPRKTRTATRSAALGLAGRLLPPGSDFTTPTQPLPPPGSPQKSPCGSSYCTWVSFYNGGAGYEVYPGVNYVTIKANGATVPNSQYFVEINDNSSPKTICSTLCPNSTTCVSFPGVAKELYVFTVCFVNPTYCKKLISMTVSPTETAVRTRLEPSKIKLQPRRKSALTREIGI